LTERFEYLRYFYRETHLILEKRSLIIILFLIEFSFQYLIIVIHIFFKFSQKRLSILTLARTLVDMYKKFSKFFFKKNRKIV